MSLKALICGGGIGGLTAALALSARGFTVELIEQGSALAETGAGIQLSPNCTRVLHSLGLEENLRRVGFVPEAAEMRHWATGRLISTTKLGESLRQRTGFPYYHVHRADLSRILVDACGAEPRIKMHENCRVTEVAHTAQGVRLKAGQRVFEGDLLIGADGIHSLVREVQFGPEQPRFTGNVAWRSLVPADRLPAGLVRPMVTAWWGPGSHFVHYFVRGGEFVNCVCVVEKSGWETESWIEKGDWAELKADFAGWDGLIQQLIDAMDPDACYKWALFDRLPMAQWSRDRTTLLGDACHPTLPFMAQGAAMAIEDAAVLAQCLAADDEVATALQAYQQFRLSRTAAIQKGSRRNATVFHLSGLKALARDMALKTRTAPSMNWVYDYDPLSP